MVTAGKLIVGREKFPQFARCFYDQIGQFLSSYWICGSKTLYLVSSTHQQEKILEEEIFTGTNFRELVFDRKSCENFCLAKISCYTVYVCIYS